MKPAVITLTTDFGLQDAYVGIVKGVILDICPDVRLVDLTHQVAAQDVLQGALVLESAAPFFPDGTIHLAVVDPGVGGNRRAVAFSSPRATFVGPDNGLLGLVWQAARERWPEGDLHAVRLSNAQFHLDSVHPTFHGRDIFGPVAAHLACGVSIGEFGPPADDLQPPPFPSPVRLAQGGIQGEVIAIDHFGNCITNITSGLLQDLGPLHTLHVQVAGRDLGPIRQTYSQVQPGEPLALIGSNGRLELATRDDNHSLATNTTKHTPLEIKTRDGG
jgi:S-adenosylmethionine hydrolase